jgi:hypothetical protein
LRLDADTDTTRTRVALFQPAAQEEDSTLVSLLCTMADSVELSLDLLQRYEVRRLPPADPAKDLNRVRTYCQENRIDQAIFGSGSARKGGGYAFRLMVYDRKTDRISTDRHGASSSALDTFDVTDALVASLLDQLSGEHLLFGSLSVETDPAGAAVSINGRDVGTAPLSLRGLPVGTVQLAARVASHEEAQETVAIADGQTASASLRLARSIGRLTVRTPTDSQVTVSNAEIGQKMVAAPASLDLPTGDYLVTAAKAGLASVSGRVTVVRNVGVSWAPWTSRLSILDAPSGSTVKVDGESVDSTLATAGGADVPAGRWTVSVESPGVQVWKAEILLNPGGVTRQSVNRMAWQIPKRTIDLSGASSQWAGLVPFWADTRNYGSFKGQPGTHIAQGYVCRDDTYLYVRIDFSDGKPSAWLAGNIKGGLVYNFTIDNSNVMKVIHIGILFNRGSSGAAVPVYLRGIQGHPDSLDPALLVYRIGQSDIEMRIPTDFIMAYTSGTPFMRLGVADDILGPSGWGHSAYATESRQVDFGF